MFKKGIPLLFLILFLGWNYAFPKVAEKAVVVLHSYYPGYVWADNITSGIQDHFADKEVIIDFEYLDTPEYTGKAYDQAFFDLLMVKYAGIHRPDALIVADNPALEFQLKYGNALLPGVPVIFCGINYFQDSMIGGYPNITGVVEEISLKENLDLIHRLHPYAKRLYVCVTDNPTGRANKELLFQSLSNNAWKPELRFISNTTVKDANSHIAAISREDVLLVMTVFKNEKGENLPAGLSIRMALSNSVVPAYSFWDFTLGNGVVGGKIVSGYDQGSNAAAMTYRVLQGEDIRNIPILSKSPNRFMFDHDQLKRFGISADKLPEGNVIIHRPVPLLEKHRNILVFIFLGLFMVIGFLMLYVFQQRKSANALRELSEFQQNLFDSIPNAVYYKDLKGRYTGCNKSFTEFFEISKERLIGKTVFEIFPKEQAELMDYKDRELLRTGEKQVFESDVPRSNGESRTLASVKTLFRHSNGRPFGIIGVFIDITVQKQVVGELNRAMEKAQSMNLELEINRNYLNKIINSISDPVFVKDSRFRWVLLNDAYCEFMGYKREELLGKTDFDFFPQDQAAVFREKDEIVLRSLFENVNEEEFTDKAGRTHTIVTKKSLYVDGQKNKFIVGIISDVTERKKLEDELKLMNQNLGEKVWEEVNKNREKDLLLIKQSRQAAMGEMIRNIAHQWRQPLNALGIIIQNFREQNDFGKLDKEYIDRNVKKAVDLVQFMSRTIDDFKDFFKPDREITRFSVKDALFRAIAVVEASMKNNYIELDIALEKEVFAKGFMNEYSQVVLNILSNAKDILLEKKTQKPRVRIILTETDGKSELIIWNNGGEIPDDVIARIFEPYFTTKESGTGIGLFMSKMIIEKNMNGKISVRNIDGGAEFRVVV